MAQFDIRRWVTQSPQHLTFRQAVHVILVAISKSPSLQKNMIMKGGILLALGYDSSRYTKDVDFSTAVTLHEFDPTSFRREFEASLARAVDQLGYDLDCIVQSCRQNPQSPTASFPTIRIKVGYAKKSDASAHRRLLRKNSSQVVQVDYSLNEPPGDPQLIEIQDGHSIRTYSFHDLIGEKLRALLQQEVRDRFRRQDIYDLHFVLKNHLDRTDRTLKEKILKSLKQKASARGLVVGKDSMRNDEIRRRSQREYETLAGEVDGELPPFDEIFDNVRDYYESLPWG